jgi:hypothetical protein
MRRGTVVTYASPGPEDEHERATHGAIARILAELKDFQFGGDYDPSARHDGPLYFVPGDTLLVDRARALGIRTRDDLFGGVVPFPFVATKAIVHPLVERSAQAPQGWSRAFAKRVRGEVLPGFTAFTVEDARRGGLRLISEGPVRLKPGHGVGGHGQAVVADAAGLEEALAGLDRSRLARFGVAVELDLAEAATYSIGQVWVGMPASYCGTQRSTTDNRGGTAFGGSDLVVVRGGFDALGALPLAPDMRRAFEQAQAFDAAAMEEFPGLFASRRNYDAVCGRDHKGRWRCGILEQSWRIGGASGPEVAALAALRADSGLRAVRARSIEAYGRSRPPPGAIVHYSGVDGRIGAITKYTIVEAHEAG